MHHPEREEVSRGLIVIFISSCRKATVACLAPRTHGGCELISPLTVCFALSAVMLPRSLTFPRRPLCWPVIQLSCLPCSLPAPCRCAFVREGLTQLGRVRFFWAARPCASPQLPGPGKQLKVRKQQTRAPCQLPLLLRVTDASRLPSSNLSMASAAQRKVEAARRLLCSPFVFEVFYDAKI